MPGTHDLALFILSGLLLNLAPPRRRSASSPGPSFTSQRPLPKVALFFVAFLPQFVDADAPSKAAALLFLGAVFNFNGTLWNLFVAWSSARISGGLMRNARFARWFNRCVGGLFVVLGIRLALTSER